MSSELKIGGFTADIDDLTEGLLGMIVVHPDGNCIVLGMLPADLMELFDLTLEAKVKDKTTRAEIIKHVAARTIGMASERGLCIV